MSNVDLSRYDALKREGKASIIKRGSQVAIICAVYDPQTGAEALPQIVPLDPARIAEAAAENRRVAAVLDLLHADATAALKTKKDVG